MKPQQSKKETPLMSQHQSIKRKYPDAILLFRVGDFYETFGEDAVAISQILNITLTKRNKGKEDSAVLAGFPYHALDTYLHKIVKAGRRVAICDQLESPQQAKGLVKRGVTEVVTPGVTLNDKILTAKENNYLAVLHRENNQMGVAFLDVSTSSFYVAEGAIDYMQKLLHSFAPSEVIIAKSLHAFFKEQIGTQYYIYTLDDWIFDYEFSRDLIVEHFEVHNSLKGFGLDTMPRATIATGVIMHYLKEIKYPNLGHIQQIKRITRDHHMWMDAFTYRNLEIETGRLSFVSVLDKTQTPMGSRLLKRWIKMPLIDKNRIEDRLSLTKFFIENVEVYHEVLSSLTQIGDVERIINKVPTRKINPREVLNMAQALKLTEAIKKTTAQVSNTYLVSLSNSLHSYNDLVTSIEKTIVENPPIQSGKEPLIQSSINKELDELRFLLKSNEEGIAKIQQEAITETGISGIKVGFNQVFGYYLEVTNMHKDKVPTSWIRKQTLTNAERYITEDLQRYEEKILGAQEKIQIIEQHIYEELLQNIEQYISQIIQDSNIVATIDCLQGFATVAVANNYCCPTITEGEELTLKESRHPIIEQQLKEQQTGNYIPNDILINQSDQQILIITGPNMSGKSALIRQIALNTLMAHIGSFVACSHATIPITDRIFTRVGAQDNIAEGESTFMVEMNEVASIINNISNRSLILLDELGRGTATYDGISIAWSILEYIVKHPCKPKALFSTHYHELVNIEESFPQMKNFHISNREENNKIVFLRTIKRGGSKHSFGIHVAKMAGLPHEVTQRATDILQALEQDTNKKNMQHAQDIINLIDTPKEEQPNKHINQVVNLLKQIDIERLTPVEALLKIQEIKNLLN